MTGKIKVIIDGSLDDRTFIIDGKKMGLVEMRNHPTPPKEIHLNKRNADILMNKSLQYEDMFYQLEVSEKEDKEESEDESN